MQTESKSSPQNTTGDLPLISNKSHNELWPGPNVVGYWLSSLPSEEMAEKNNTSLRQMKYR